MFEDFPKEVTLPDGFRCQLRPMHKDDHDLLYRFFMDMAEEDRHYLRNDVTNRILIEKWCRELDFERVLPILAEYENKIIANATLHREAFGWGKHVGEIRITIAKEFQQRGMGSILGQELSELAQKVSLEKLCARVVASRDYVIKAFEKIGFEHTTTLKNFVKSIHDNSYNDIAVLVKDLKN